MSVFIQWDAIHGVEWSWRCEDAIVGAIEYRCLRVSVIGESFLRRSARDIAFWVLLWLSSG